MKNVGNLRAASVCLELESSLSLDNINDPSGESVPGHGAGPGVLLELRHPVYPGMEIFIDAEFWVYDSVLKSLMGSGSLATPFAVRVFADNSTPQSRRFHASEVGGWQGFLNALRATKLRVSAHHL